MNLLRVRITGIVVAACFFVSALSNAAEPVTSATDLVAHHLESIGDAKARTGIQSRAAAGTAHFHIMVGGDGTLDGKSQFVSQGGKFHFLMKFPNNEYRGERFVYDGTKIHVSAATTSLRRSELGGFLYSQDAVFREGFWGGVLSTSWPLLDLDKHRAKLSLDGIKKLDGENLYELRYQPKKNTDLEIRLYFDPATYRHIRTVYTLRPGLAMGSEITNPRQQQNRYELEERFSNFQTIDGLTLPSRYDIRFTEELQSGRTTAYEWEILESSIINNVSLDPRNFEIK